MSAKSNKVLDACAKYVETMKALGKQPSAIYVTREQYKTVVEAERSAMRKAGEKDETVNAFEWSHYRELPVRVHG